MLLRHQCLISKSFGKMPYRAAAASAIRDGIEQQTMSNAD